VLAARSASFTSYRNSASEILRLRHRSTSRVDLQAARVSVLGAASGVKADLADRCDVDPLIHRPLPGRGEAVAVLLTRRRPGGAVPVQEGSRLRSANRTTSPTSARVRAATRIPAPLGVVEPFLGRCSSTDRSLVNVAASCNARILSVALDAL